MNKARFIFNLLCLVTSVFAIGGCKKTATGKTSYRCCIGTYCFTAKDTTGVTPAQFAAYITVLRNNGYTCN